ncbi:hypothetical protein [Azospirillum brasilense]|uniref:hypothetical protein n=1 Tax=Azospirillum brasilense TaxID=192 RepID=UPI001EDB0704|nr:hypothetical protein [Azospirillum brasilense]UKJ74626.1 hypothetical protein H1Q64_18920 [Azospirillum brasilense]
MQRVEIGGQTLGEAAQRCRGGRLQPRGEGLRALPAEQFPEVVDEVRHLTDGWRDRPHGVDKSAVGTAQQAGRAAAGWDGFAEPSQRQARQKPEDLMLRLQRRFHTVLQNH